MVTVNNEKGAVLVFVTLMIVLLMIMVGMGLDTGQLTYTRSQGQAAVDAAVLSAVSGLPIGDADVKARVQTFNSNNDYLNSPNNPIMDPNITYVQYDSSTGAIKSLPDIKGANGVRVALESTNPYTTVAAGTAMQSPVFLTPLMRLFGQSSAPAKVDVSVSAVSVLTAKPSIPIAIYESICGAPNVPLVTSPATTDNSCWTTYWDPPVNTPIVQDLFTSTKTCSQLPNGGTGPIFLGNGVNTPVYESAKSLFTQYPKKCWIVPVVKDGSTCNRTDGIVDWAEICPAVGDSDDIIDVVFPGKAGGGLCPSGDPSEKCIVVKVTCGMSLYRTDNSLCFASRLVREPKSGTCPGCSM
jgi:Flp pilus assembly protein TadG